MEGNGVGVSEAREGGCERYDAGLGGWVDEVRRDGYRWRSSRGSFLLLPIFLLFQAL